MLLDSSTNDYTRWRLAQILSELALPPATRADLSHAERLRQLDPDLPAPLLAYLQAGLLWYRPEPHAPRLAWRSLLPGWRPPGASGPLALDPAIMVAYL